MRLGRLKFLVDLQKEVVSGTDDYGGPIKSFVTQQQVWVDISPLSLTTPRGASQEVLDGAQQGVDTVIITGYYVVGVNSTEWRIRYENPDSDDPKPVKIYTLLSARPTAQLDFMAFAARLSAEQEATT